jgi:hypothetical protein
MGKKRRPRICGECIYYEGDGETGICSRLWETAEKVHHEVNFVRYYNQVACYNGEKKEW